MAIASPYRPFVYNRGRLYPASMYSRPAAPVFYAGLNGYNPAMGYNTQQFQYTLEQMAVSPFSVNNAAYMERIREAYNIRNSGLYESFGAIGGAVGAGVGAGISAGYLQKFTEGSLNFLERTSDGWPYLRFKQPSFRLQNPWVPQGSVLEASTWKDAYNPKKLAYKNKVMSRYDRLRGTMEDGRTGLQVHNEYRTLLQQYNRLNDEYLEAADKLVELGVVQKSQMLTEEILNKIPTRHVTPEIRNVVKTVRQLYKQTDEAATAANAVGDILRSAEIAEEAVTTGAKAATKTVGGLPVVGTVFDVASMALSGVGLKQSIEAGNAELIALNATALVGDVFSVAGSALQIIGTTMAASGVGTGPGVLLLGLGTGIDVIGSVVSLGASAIIGKKIGETVGRSFSAEGAKAQQLFATNLYAGIQQRPITTVASAMAMVGIPAALNKLTANANIGKGILRQYTQNAATWLTTNAVGNQVRAGISMMALQGISPLTTKLEDSIGLTPANPEEMNFVSAISVYGDINDNLYGATRNKAILLGLAEGDSDAMVRAMGQSWGEDPGIFQSVMFDDIREATGIDLGPFGNSLVSTIGELLIDPQNFNEIYDRAYRNSTANYIVAGIERYTNMESARMYTTKNPDAVPSSIKSLLQADGILGTSLNQMEKRRRLLRIVHAYLEDGDKGLAKAVEEIGSIKQRSLEERGRYTPYNLDEQTQTLRSLFQNLFETNNFAYGGYSKAQLKDVRDAYYEYRRIQKMDPATLTDEQEMIQRNVSYAFRRLKERYGNTMSEPALFRKFQEDLQVKQTIPYAAKSYIEYQRMRHHMDLTDAFAGIVTRITNPVMTATKGITYALDLYLERQRVNTSLHKQQESIITLEKAKEHIKNVYRQPTSLEIKNQNKHVETILNSPFEQEIDITLRTFVEQEAETQVAAEGQRTQMKETATMVEEVIDYYDERADVYKTAAKYNEYGPQLKYEHDNGETIIVSNKNIDALQKYIKENEHLYQRTVPYARQTLTEKRFHATRGAVMSYLYHTNHYDILHETILKVRELLAESNDATNTLQETVLDVFYVQHVFRRLANIFKKKVKLMTVDGKRRYVPVVEQEMDVNKLLLDRLHKNDDDANELAAFLNSVGFDIEYTYILKDEDGNEIKETSATYATLAARGVQPETIDVNLVYRTTVEQEILGAIKRFTTLNDLDLLLQGSMMYTADITAQVWADATVNERFDILIRLLNETGVVTKEVFAKIVETGTLERLYERVNSVLLGNGRKVLPLEGTDSKYLLSKIRAIVFEKAYRDPNNPLRQTIERMSKGFEELQKVLDDLKESLEASEYLIIQEVLKHELSVLNQSLRAHPFYRFLSAHLYPRTSDIKKQNYFIAAQALEETAVKIPYLYEAGVVTKHNKRKDTLIEYIESPVIQGLLKDRAVDAQMLHILPDDVEVKDKKETKYAQQQQRLKKNRAQRQAIKGIKKAIRANVQKELQDEMRGMLILVKMKGYHKTNTAPVLSFEGSNKEILERALKNKFEEALESLTFHIHPRVFAKLGDEDLADLKTYYDVLKEDNRKSLGHDLLLQEVFTDLLYWNASDKSNVKLDIQELSKTLKANNIDYRSHKRNGVSDDALAVLIAAYKNKIEIPFTLKLEMKDFLRYKEWRYESMYGAVEDFMYRNSNHKAFVNYELRKDGDGFLKEHIDDFVERILLQEDNLLTDADYTNIVNTATEELTSRLATQHLNDAHYKILHTFKEVGKYEQNDVQSMHDRKAVLDRGLAKKEILLNGKYRDAIHDILKLATTEYFVVDQELLNTLKNDNFKLLYLLKNHVRLDKANKTFLNVHSFEEHYIDPETNMYTAVQKDKQGNLKRYTMFDLMRKYHMTKNDITQLHNRLSKDKKKETYTRIHSKMIAEYTYLAEMYGGLLVAEHISLGKEQYITQRTQETNIKNDAQYEDEYKLLMDVDANYLINALVLNKLLNTQKAPAHGTNPKTGEPYRRRDNVENIKTLLDPKVFQVYQDTLNKLESGGTLEYNGETLIAPKDFKSLFAMNILLSKLPKTTKHDIFHDVFFHQHHILKGNVTERNILNLKKRLVQYREIRENAIADGRSYTEVDRAIDDIENRITLMEQIKENIEDIALEDFDVFFETLLKNPTQIPELLYRTYQGTDTKRYVLAKDYADDGSYNYVLVKQYQDAAKTVENVDRTEIFGLPSYNLVIGKYIIAASTAEDVANKNKIIQTQLKDKKDTIRLVEYADKQGALLIASDPKTIKDDIKHIVRKVLGIKQTKDIYVITEKQYQEIKDMKRIVEEDAVGTTKEERTRLAHMKQYLPKDASGAYLYTTTYEYRVKKDPKTQMILGRPQQNVINTKSAKTMIDLYLHDLKTVYDYANKDMKRIKELVDKFYEYSQLRYTQTYMSTADIEQTDYTQTPAFKTLVERAKHEDAFLKFLDAVDPDNTFDAVSIETIGSLFFNDAFIKIQADGTYKDLSHLETYIRQPNIRKEFQEKKIKGMFVITRVRRALEALRKEYGFSALTFNYTKILEEDFTDTLIKIGDVTSRYAKNLGKLNSRVYKDVYSPLQKTEETGYRLDANASTLHHIRRLLQRYTSLDSLRPQLLYPYNRKKKGAKKTPFEQAVAKLTQEFQTKGQFGPHTIEDILYVNSKNIKEKGIAENIKYNQGLHKNTRGVNYIRFTDTMDVFHNPATKEVERFYKKSNLNNYEVAEEIRLYWLEQLNVAIPIVQKYTAINPELTPPSTKANSEEIEGWNVFISARRFVMKWYPVYQKNVKRYGNTIKAQQETLKFHIVTTYLNNMQTSIGFKHFLEFLPAANDAVAKNPKKNIDDIANQLYNEWKKKRKTNFRLDSYQYLTHQQTGVPLTNLLMGDILPGAHLTPEGKKLLQTFSKNVGDTLEKVSTYMFTQDEPADRKIKIPLDKHILEYNNAPEYLESIKDPVKRDITAVVIELFIFKQAQEGDTINKVLERLQLPTRVDEEETIFPVDPDVFTTIYSILKSKKNQEYKSHNEIYQTLSLPVLDDSKAFKEFVYKYFFAPEGKTVTDTSINVPKEILERNINSVLRLFGLDYNKTINVFESFPSMQHVINILKTDVKDKQHMYALTMILNALKIKYLDQYYETHHKARSQARRARKQPVWTMQEVVQDFKKKPLQHALRTYKDIQDTRLFKEEFADDPMENSIIIGAQEGLRFIQDALSYTENMNDLLGMVRIPNDVKVAEINKLEQQYIRTTLTSINRAVVKEQRRLRSAMFKKNTDDNVYATLASLQQNALNDLQYDLMQERNAESVYKVGSGNLMYNRLRILYTEAFKALYPQLKDDEYLRLSEVDTTFDILLTQRHVIAYYETQYDKYANLLPEGTKAAEEALNKLIEGVAEYRALLPLKTRFAKAILGHLYVQRFVAQDPELFKVYKKEFQDFLKMQQAAEHEKNLYDYNRLMQFLESVTDVEELIQIMYPEEVLGSYTPEKRAHAEDMIKQMRALGKISTTALKDIVDNHHDTFEVANYMTEDIVVDKELTKTLVGILKERGESLIKQIEKYEQDQSKLEQQFQFNYLHAQTAAAQSVRYQEAYDTTRTQLQEVEQTLRTLRKTATAEYRQLLLDIFTSNPVLVKAHIERQNRYIKKRSAEFYKDVEKVRKNYSKTFLDIYDEYRKATKKGTAHKQPPKNADAIKWYTKKALDDAYAVYDKRVASLEKLRINPEHVDAKTLNESQIRTVTLEASIENYLKDLRKKYKKVLEQEKDIQKEFLKQPIGILTADEKKEVLAKIDGLLAHALKELQTETDLFKAETGVSEFTEANITAYVLKQPLFERRPVQDWYNDIKKIQAYIKDLEKTAQRLNDAPTTVQDVLHAAIKHFDPNNEITNKQVLVDKIFQYVDEKGKSNEKIRELEEKQERLGVLYKQVEKDWTALQRYIITNKTTLEELRQEYRELQEEILVAQKKIERLQRLKRKEYPNRNTNLGTYMNLNNHQSDVPKETVLNEVIERTAKMFYEGDSKRLRQEIKEQTLVGDIDVHNAIVDVLIAQLNYVDQLKGKDVPKEYIVFDMETLEDTMGRPTPWQMTFLKVKDGKMEIFNMYLSNKIFFEDNEPDTETGRSRALEKFYKDRYDMVVKEQPELATQKDLVEQETTKLVEKIRENRNDIYMITTFINEISARDLNVPIVTHNGKRFDMIHYNNFLKKVSHTLLLNLQHRIMEDLTPKNVYKHLEKHYEDPKKVFIEASQKIHKRIHEKIQRKEEITKREIKALYKLYRESLKIVAEHARKTIETKLGYRYYTELKTQLDEQIPYIESKFYEFITTKDSAAREQIMQELIVYYKDGARSITGYTEKDIKDIEQYVTEELLEASEAAYHMQLTADTPIDVARRSNTLKGLVREEVEKQIAAQYEDAFKEVTHEFLKYEEGFVAKDFIANREQRIRANERVINYLQSGVGNDKQIRLEQTVKKQQKLQEQIDEVVRLKEELQTAMVELKELSKDNLEKINKQSEVLLKATLGQAQQAFVSLKGNLNKTLSDQRYAHNNKHSGRTLKHIMDESLERANAAYKQMQALMQYLRGTKDKKELYNDPKIQEELLRGLDPRILYERNEQKDQTLLETFRKEIIEWRALKEDIKQPHNTQDVRVKAVEGLVKEVEENILKRIQHEYDLLIKDWNTYAPSYNQKATLMSALKESSTWESLKQQNIKDLLRARFEELKAVRHQHQNDPLYQELLLRTSQQAELVQLLDLLHSKEKVGDKVLTMNMPDILQTVIDLKIQHLEHSYNILQQLMYAKTEEELDVAIMHNKMEELLSHLEGAKTAGRKMQYNNLLNYLEGGQKRVQDMSEEELEFAANQKMSKEQRRSLHVKDHVHVYQDLYAGEDYEGLLPDVIFRTSNKEHHTNYKLSSPDQNLYGKVYVQSWAFNEKAPNTITLNLTYYYRHASAPNVEQTPIVIKDFKFDPKRQTTQEILDSLFVHRKDNKTEQGLTGLKKEDVFVEPGKSDAAYEDIKELLDHLNNEIKRGTFQGVPYGSTSKKQEAAYKKRIEAYKKNVISDRDFSSKHYKRYNISNILNERFNDYLDLLHNIDDDTVRQDINEVYQGLHQYILGSYRTFDKSKLFNMIPKDVSTMFITQYELEDLERLGIDVTRGAEASAAVVNTKYVEALSTPTMFAQHINTIRSYIGNPKKHSLYTPSKFINKYLDIKEAMKEGTFKQRLEHLLKYDTNETLLKDALVREYVDEQGKTQWINMFTPNVNDSKTARYYKKNIFHAVGMNLIVGFNKHPAAHEDVLLIDAALASAIKHDEGMKTWLDFAGYKGGVRYIENLYKDLGVHIIGEVKSVKGRNTNNLLLTQLTNTIKYYLVNKKYNTDKQNNILSAVESYWKEQGTKDIYKKYIKIQDGKAIVDPLADWDKIYEAIFKPAGYAYLDVIQKEFTEDVYSYAVRSDGSVDTYNFKNSNMYFGELYVLMDPKNTADNMYGESETFNIDDIELPVQDYRSNDVGGVEGSPSVMKMLETAGIDVEKALLTEDTAYKKSELYTKIACVGLSYFLENPAYQLYIQGTKQYDVNKIIKKIKQQEPNLLLETLESYIHYTNLLKETTKDNEKEEIKQRLEQLDYSATQKAYDLTVGRHGTDYRAPFHKHHGARGQLLSNVQLKPGEVVVPAAAWKHYNTEGKGFLALQELEETQWLQLLNGYRLKYANGTEKLNLKNDTLQFKTKKERDNYILYLNSRGVTNDPIENENVKDIIYTTPNDTSIVFKQHAQKYGYVLAIRSPVQGYKAVVRVKVIGYHQHNAFELTPYVYAYMNADNDGDTGGFLTLSQQNKIDNVPQYKYFDNVDATKVEDDDTSERFYRKGHFKKDKNSNWEKTNDYLEEMKKKLTHDGSEDNRVYFGKLGIAESGAGKNTYDGLRKHNNYTKGEMYSYVLPEAKEELKKIVINPNAHLTWTVEDLRLYLNVAIKAATEGIKNTLPEKKITRELLLNGTKEQLLQVYSANEKLKTLAIQNKTYDDNMNNPLKYLKAEHLMYALYLFSEEDQAVIKKIGAENIIKNKGTYKELLERALGGILFLDGNHRGLTRGNTSKRGVSLMGGARKDELALTRLIRLNNLNLDATGRVWQALLLSEKIDTQYITIRNLLDARGGRNKNEYLQAIRTWFRNNKNIHPDDANRLYKLIAKDIDGLIKMTNRDAALAQDTMHDLTVLATILARGTYKKLVEFLKANAEKAIQKGKYKTLYEYFQTKKGKIDLDSWQIQVLYGMYFHKNDATMRTYKKHILKLRNTLNVKTVQEDIKDFAEEVGNTYVEQYILNLPVLQSQDERANDILAVSKHGDKNANYVRYLNEYEEEIRTRAERYSVRRVTHPDDPDYTYVSGLGADTQTYKDIKVDRTALSEQESKVKVERSGVTINEEYQDADIAKGDLRVVIEEDAKQLLFGTLGYPQYIYNNVKEILTTISTNLDTRDLLASFKKKVIITLEKNETKQTFERSLEELFGLLNAYGIPAYKVLYLYETGFSKYEKVNQVLNENNLTMSLKNIPFIDAGTKLWHLLLKLKHYGYQQDFKELVGKRFENSKTFLLGLRDLDIDYAEFYQELNSAPTTRSSYARMHPYHQQELISMMNSSGIDETRIQEYLEFMENSGDFKQVVFLEALEILGLQDVYSVPNLRKVIDHVIQEYILAENAIKTVENIAKKKEKEKGKVDEGFRQTYKDVYGRHITNRPRRLLGAAYNQYKNAERLLEELDIELNNLEDNRLSLEDNRGIYQTTIDYLEQTKNPEDLIDALKQQNQDEQEKIEEIKKMVAIHAMQNAFKKGIAFLHTSTGKTYSDALYQKPRLVGDPTKTEDEFKTMQEADIETLKHSHLMNMENYMIPFLSLASHYRISKGTEEVRVEDGRIHTRDMYDWQKMFEAYKRMHRYRRLALLVDGFDNEGLLRLVWHELKHASTDKKGKTKYVRFESFDDVIKYLKDLNHDDNKTIKLGKQKYSTSDLKDMKIVLKDKLSPTLKEIEIKNAEGLKAVYEWILDYAQKNNRTLSVGFVDLNDWLTARETAYNILQLDGKASKLIRTLQYAQKLAMRLSYGFLFRNYIDTWAQIYSEMYQQRGLYGMAFDTSDVNALAGKITKNNNSILRIMGMTHILYDRYKDISEERFLTLSDVVDRHEQIDHIINKTNAANITHADARVILTNMLYLRQMLQRYIAGVDHVTEEQLKNKLKFRKSNAEYHLGQLESLLNTHLKLTVGTTGTIDDIQRVVIDKDTYNYKQINGFKDLYNNKTMKDIATFLMRMHFSEYFILYDYLKYDGDGGKNKHRQHIEEWRKRFELYTDDKGRKIYDADFQDVQHILFEMSAFMETNAQIDTYRQEHYKYLHEMVERRREQAFASMEERSYESLRNEINTAKRTYQNKLFEIAFKGYKNFYADLNETIENTARIGAYLLDRYLYNYNYQETVNRSLKRWFNYGQKSPLETQLIADIPYLSFPIRSIDNWLDRFFDPSYQRVLSDIVDGVYGQYTNEDGQYDPYEQFMIQNGWIPIAKNFGLRFGFGLYDVQNILNDTRATMLQRRNPLYRAVDTLINTGDITESMKQLATVGIVTRSMNTFGPRNTLQNASVFKDIVKQQPRSIGNTLNFTFTYNNYEYTPYKYRYNTHNARYTRYENIYKQWFTKYGKMRQPTVDPLRLVKDIQWKQYVRYRQSRNMTGYFR